MNRSVQATEQKNDVGVFPIKLAGSKHDGEHDKHFVYGHGVGVGRLAGGLCAGKDGFRDGWFGWGLVCVMCYALCMMMGWGWMVEKASRVSSNLYLLVFVLT